MTFRSMERRRRELAGRQHNQRVATAHLIHGYIGAGKTTLAARLGELTGGLRLSIDELFLVTCADEVAKARCLRRNSDPAASFVIDEAAFEALRPKFEPAGPDEAFDLVDTTDWEGLPHHL